MSHPLMRVFFATALGVAILSSPAVVFGWGSATHGSIANAVLDYPEISAWLTYYGFNNSSDRAVMVSTASGEPDKATYQHWANISEQRFRVNQGDRSIQASDLSWGLTPFHIGVLLHLGGDAAVPIGHSPARTYWANPDGIGTEGAEAGQEMKSSWIVPSIVEDPGATYAAKINYHETHIADIARRYEAGFLFDMGYGDARITEGPYTGYYVADLYQGLDSTGYNTGFFSEALPYAAPLGVTILNDYFLYHNGGVPIPEPSVFAMLSGLAAGLFWGFGRRR